MTEIETTDLMRRTVALRPYLKTGNYNGSHIMEAWILLDGLAAACKAALAERDGAVLALKNIAFYAREAQDNVPLHMQYDDLALYAEEAVVAIEKGWKNDHQYRPYGQEETPLTEEERAFCDAVLRRLEGKLLSSIAGAVTHTMTVELESGVNYFVCKHHPIEHMQRQPCDQCGGGSMAYPVPSRATGHCP